MRIDSTFIRDERQRRGWSQEQLAAAAGLGVRTIQRLESSGIGSSESAKCVAAVFEVPFTRLIAQPAAPAPVPATLAAPGVRAARLRLWGAAAAVMLGLASSLALIPRANATDIAMAVVVDAGAGESRMNLKVESGAQTEIKLEKSLRMVMTPTALEGDHVFVTTELYRWDGTGFTLAGKPKLLMRSGQESRLQLDLGDGQVVRIRVTPKAG